jgi:hypothetical protein
LVWLIERSRWWPAFAGVGGGEPFGDGQGGAVVVVGGGGVAVGDGEVAQLVVGYRELPLLTPILDLSRSALFGDRQQLLVTALGGRSQTGGEESLAFPIGEGEVVGVVGGDQWDGLGEQRRHRDFSTNHAKAWKAMPTASS